MALKIISMNVVGSCTYKEATITDGKCELCRYDILGPAPDDIKDGNYVSSIIFGKCKHCFHSKCFSKTQKITCPIDKTPWVMEKEIKPHSECAVSISIPKTQPIKTDVKVI